MMAREHPFERLRLVLEEQKAGPRDEHEALEPSLDPALQRRPEDFLDEEGPVEEEEPPARRRRLLPATLGALVLAGFGAAVWYVYFQGIGADKEELPLVQAEAGPVKTRPLEPGGLEVPYQDQLVLNEVAPDPAKPQVERLLPPPEVPKPPEESVAAPSAETGELAPAAGPSDEAEAPAVPEAAATAEAGQPPAADEPSLPPPPAPEQPAEQTTAAAQPPAEPEAAEPTPEPPPPPAPAEAAPAPAPEAKPAPAPDSAAQTAAVVPGGAFLIQLASLKQKAGVEQEWARLRQAYPDLLAGLRLSIQSVDLGSRGTFHRLQAGFLRDRASAEALCARLKAKKQDCLVVER